MRKIIDDVAVKINNSIELNYKRRLQNSNDIREIYIDFIDIDLDANLITKTYHEELTRIVRITHFSIQKYLKFKRIRYQKAAKFSLISVTTHNKIA